MEEGAAGGLEMARNICHKHRHAHKYRPKAKGELVKVYRARQIKGPGSHGCSHVRLDTRGGDMCGDILETTLNVPVHE